MKINGENFPIDEVSLIMNSYRKGRKLVEKNSYVLKNFISEGTTGKIFSEQPLLSIMKSEESDEIIEAAKENLYGLQLIKDAEDAMIRKLDGFIYWIIRRYFGTFANNNSNIEEFYQLGSLGILNGMINYDETISKPTTFFRIYIIHEISDYIEKNIQKLTDYYAANAAKIRRVLKRKNCTLEDIARETGLSIKVIQRTFEVLDMTKEVHYIHIAEIENKISDHYTAPEAVVIQAENKDILHKAIKNLSEEEQVVIRLRYGFDDENPCSYREISLKTDIPIAKVIIYCKQALKKLSESLKDV